MFKSATSSGVPSSDVERRRQEFGSNALPTHEKSTIWAQIWGVVREPMLLLLLAAGAINFALAEPLDGFLLMFMVLVVIGISIYQEHKSENALAALRELSAPTTRVVRDGIEKTIRSDDLVVGDIVLLSEGDRVPADLKILESGNFALDESALTGESVQVEKFAGSQEPSLFAGTLVVRGWAKAEVAATGIRTEIGKIGRSLSELQNGKTPMQVEVSKLIFLIAGIALVAATLVAITFSVSRGDLLNGLLAGIATAMAMLPEEFPVVLAVFMALGAWRMSKVHVLARRPQVIETLGSATVVCADKTGTITTNKMEVAGYYGADPAELARFASLASALNPTDPMDKAFRASSGLAKGWTLIREYPLERTMLAVANVWKSPEGKLFVAAKGAPEAIAELAKGSVSSELATYATRGERVLGLASATHEGELPDNIRGFNFEQLGLSGLRDPIRNGVTEAVADCYTAGIRTIMITGDYPATALAIAKEVGLEIAAGCLTGAEVAELSDGDLSERLKTTNVFARMIPEQKLRIVRALQEQGHVVAMTGDGVNDAPALKASDIGIAMGLRGTDVAREAADLILTDDDFSSIVRGIRNGRGIFSNLRKAMAYIVSVHVPLLGMALLPVFIESWPLVLLPVLIAVIELIVDPACSVVFEAEQVSPKIMNEKPRAKNERIFKAKVLAIALTQGLSSFVAVAIVYFWAIQSGHSEAETRTLTFLTLIIGNVLLILSNRSWHLSIVAALIRRKNQTLIWLIVGVGILLGALLNIPVLRDAFGLAAVMPWEFALAAGAAGLGISWFELYKRFRR